MMIRVVAVASLLTQQAFADPLFRDMSGNLPLHEYQGGWTHFVGGGLAVFDCDNNGLPDVYAAGGTTPALLLRNEGGFEFSKVKVPRLTGVTGAYPIDFDSDGFKDLFVLRVGPNAILKGGPDCSFSEATAQFGIPQDDRWSTAFTAWWDGAAPTLAIGNYVDRNDPNGPFEACDENYILEPVGGSYAKKALEPGFCPLSILAAKDARGQLTLRLSNDRHYYVSGGHEQMWDIRQGRFLEERDGWNDVAIWGMGIASRDLNGDGRDEVMLTSMGDQLLQFARPDGSYVNADYSIGSYAQRPHVGDDGRPSTGWHAEFADVDNDGDADLFIAKGNVDQMPGMATRDPNNLLIQQPDGTFVETAATAGVATVTRGRGAAFADFDQDGLLDLIVSNRRAPLELYRNVSAKVGNAVFITLRQNGPNRDAIGATMTVTAGAVSSFRQNVIGGGHAGGQLLPLHFGLGENERASISVTWPDGSVSTHAAAAGNRITLVKP
jgi:hypothetical protein